MGPPLPLAAGTVRLVKARLLDAFGRTLELPAAGIGARRRSATRSTGTPGALRMRPRLPRPARWMFRLVDAAGGRRTAARRAIDQVDPSGTVNPVGGFLLPDHLDESLEVFDVAGSARSASCSTPRSATVSSGRSPPAAPARPTPARCST